MMEVRQIDSLFWTDNPRRINHEGIATLYACVRLITNTVASTPLKHVDESETELQDSVLTARLKSPQAYMPYFQWMQNLVHDYTLHGNGYALIVEDEIIYIPQHMVQVYITNEPSEPYYYLITRGDKTFRLFPDQMIHIRNMTTEGILGLSPLKMHRATFESAQTLNEYNQNFMKQGTSISGIIELDKKLSPENMEILRKSFARSYSGANNAGKTSILPEGTHFKQVSPVNPADADFINNYKLTKANIAEIFQVPLSMLGTSDLSYNNAEQNALTYHRFTINPILRNIEQELSLKLIGTKRRDKLLFITDSLALASTKEKSDSLSLLVNTQIMTPNEARKKYGLPPITGGDKFISSDVGKALAQPKDKNQEPTNIQVIPPSKRSESDE